MKIVVKDITGENCITQEDGEEIYNKIYPLLKEGETVELDFQGVEVFASPFFNSAIGILLKDFKSDTLNALLRMPNLNPNGREVLDRVVQNSREYYSSPQFRKYLDEMIDKEARDL